LNFKACHFKVEYLQFKFQLSASIGCVPCSVDCIQQYIDTVALEVTLRDDI